MRHFHIATQYIHVEDNLFNNVQSILNKIVLFPIFHTACVCLCVGVCLFVPWVFEQRHTAFLVVRCLCCKKRFLLCMKLSFTMINGIVFHTYDSLLQLFPLYKSYFLRSARKVAGFLPGNTTTPTQCTHMEEATGMRRRATESALNKRGKSMVCLFVI